jgi:hypothetical protein
MNDPIAEEVLRTHAEIAARNGNDLRRIFEDARSREGTGGHQVVSCERSDAEEPTCIARGEPPKA